MTSNPYQNHSEWLEKLKLDPSDLIFESETYQLKMTFLEPTILHEEHQGIIDEAAAQVFLNMSNLISNAIKAYAPEHRAAVIANVSNLKRVSRRARKLLLRDLGEWDALIGIAFSGANLVVRAIGFAVVRKISKMHVSFHSTDEEALVEAKRLCLESRIVTRASPHDVFNLPTDQSTFSKLWQKDPKTMQVGEQQIRMLQRDHWRYVSTTTTANVAFTVLENKILLVAVSGAVTKSDIAPYYSLQDQIVEEMGLQQIDLILDTRKLTWSDSASRRYGEQYYVNNQHRYPNTVLIASRFVRFIVQSFTLLSRHKFKTWHLAESLEEACKHHLGEERKEIPLYEEVARDAPHQVLSELNQVILDQRDIIKQYHAHMDLLLQNITRSSWDNLLKPISMPVEKNDLFSDVYEAVELMQTDYLELVAESEQATAKAEEANRLKSLFLARMSHDLRTPLSSILGFSELLMNKARNAEEKQDLTMIYRSAEQLNLLINDLLEISSIEAGETKIKVSPVKISELLNEIVHGQQKSATDKNLSLSIEIDDSLPDLLQTDIKRIRQICSNLLTNSIKYTDRGSVLLKARSDHPNRDAHTFNLIIEVFDTGRGVPKEMHKAIFDPFRQVEETNLHPTEGKGLGLAICKNLVHAMDGVIEIESVENQGSLFRVTLPIAQVKSEPSELQKKHEKLSGHVLLVEDDKVNQLILERMLTNLGLAVTKAENGNDALNVLNKDGMQYSLILMDCQMPQMDGWMASRLIRKDLKLKTPIIALTAYTQDEDIQRCLEMGMNDFLVKPLKLNDLHQKLSEHLK